MMEGNKHRLTRGDVLNLLDSFIERMLEIKRVLLGVSVSALILAPFALGLSIFLITHPRFFAVLDEEYEFGVILSVLLGVIISVSTVWIVTGVKQYMTMKSWNDQYKDFVKEKDEIDRKIASDYGLDES